MRIIGGHDYYDGVVPFDNDADRVFVRDRKEIEFVPVDNLVLQVKPLNRPGLGREFTKLEVIFCGKRYRGIALKEFDAKTYSPFKILNIWTAERFLMHFEMEVRPPWRYGDEDRRVYSEDLDAYFAPTPVDEKTFNLLRRLGILVAIADHSRWSKTNTWIVNSDGLKNINFGSIVPTWEAYQELEMFLGTILVNDDDHMVKVSEKSKLAKHGFDKWSFKNLVHKNKPRGK